PPDARDEIDPVPVRLPGELAREVVEGLLFFAEPVRREENPLVRDGSGYFLRRGGPSRDEDLSIVPDAVTEVHRPGAEIEELLGDPVWVLGAQSDPGLPPLLQRL